MLKQRQQMNHKFAVCNNSEYECADMSDLRICPGSACKNRDNMFVCADKQYCIPKWLVCDGYTQCEDGSDEELCSICPNMHSTRERSNTYSCKHRYTGRPICANPCDGYDDLCQYYTDEDCDGISFISIMICIGIVTVLLSGMMIVSEKYPSLLQKNKRTTWKIIANKYMDFYSFDNEGKPVSGNTYMQIRMDSNFGNCLCNVLLWYKVRGKVEKVKQIACHYYKMEMLVNTDSVDIFYFNSIGTNETAQYFYSILDNSISFRIDAFINSKYPQIVSSSKYIKCFNVTVIHVQFLGRVLLHYADFVKDIILLIQIWQLMLGNNVNLILLDALFFPSVIFWTIITSIVTCEISCGVALMNNKTFFNCSTTKKVFSILFILLMPAVVHYKEMKLQQEEMHINANSRSIQIKEFMIGANSNLITTCKKKSQDMHRLRVYFKATENVSEHFPQLVILMLILMLRKTNTPKVVQMDKIFLNDNDIFILFSTAWSFFSLTKGHLSYIQALKSNYLSLVGKLMLLLLFATVLSGRLVYILIFFTPNLGLFDTNFHGILGNINVSRTFSQTSGRRKQVLLAYGVNNTPIFLEDAWSDYKMSTFFHIPISLCVLVFSGIITLHILIGYKIQSKLHIHNKASAKKKMFQTIYTLLCPPLFLDWEEVYRERKELITIKESWRKSQNILIAHIIMQCMEHIVLCTPLIMLKNAITVRNEKLEDMFPPLNDELYSTYIVNVLLGAGIALALVLPPIQYGLAQLYFKKGHPWSRILNTTLSTDQPMTVFNWYLAQVFRTGVSNVTSCIISFVRGAQQ
jgi:hypothetical protein